MNKIKEEKEQLVKLDNILDEVVNNALKLSNENYK